MKNTEKILVITGPTASGKSDLAIKTAKLLDGEIISADSRLVYRDFNIGTAKPSAEELSAVPHYMIDIVHPEETFTAGIFKKRASEKIKEILSRGKVPIIAGGTGFYIKALIEGLDIPEVEPEIDFRNSMRKLAEEKGREYLHNMLRESDPETAKKLHKNDIFRIIRALEVQKIAGKAMSEAQSLSKSLYNSIYIGLNAENREYLYERITKRVDIMIEQGLVNEVEGLVIKYGKTLSLLKTLGYKEITEYLEGNAYLDQTKEMIAKNTRNFAKRQLTWFRANKKIHWFYIDKISQDEICAEIIRIYNESI